MQTIQCSDPRSVALIAGILGSGGVIVLPTDTLYGLSTIMSSGTGHDRIVAMKGSGTDRRFVYLASGIQMVEDFIDGWGCTSREHLGSIWPAPLTAILPAGARCPRWVGATTAFRVPKMDLLLRVIDEVGEPIVSTSVNKVGKKPLVDPDAIAKSFGENIEAIAVIAPGNRGSQPSTLVDFTRARPFLVRRGAYVWPTAGKPSK